MAASKSVDWVTVRHEFEAGTPVSKLAVRHGITPSRIYQVKKKQQWTPKNIGIKNGITAASSPDVDPSDKTGRPELPRGRSIGQPMGEMGADTEALSKFSAVTGLPAPEAKAVLDQSGTEIELMRQHRKTIARAAVVAENILVRLHGLVVDGVASDVISFKTRDGTAHHRVPFLGDRESVSDALLKCTNAMSKLIPLERQAHGLKDDQADTTLPRVVFNMPGVRVVSVDGRGKVIKAEDQPTLIENPAQT